MMKEKIVGGRRESYSYKWAGDGCRREREEPRTEDRESFGHRSPTGPMAAGE